MKKKKAKQRGKSAAKHRTDQKIRLGYLSSDFGAGRTRDLLPMFFSAYDKLRFEVYAYHTGTGGDVLPFSEGEGIASFRAVGACSAEEAAGIIRRDAIDLLIDLSLTEMDDLTRGIMELHPAPYLLSFAETLRGVAAALPAVEGAGILPYCYSPFAPIHRYAYRAPLLDTGIPTIGIGGALQAGETELLWTLLSCVLPRMKAVRLILSATLATGLSERDFARIAALGSEDSSLTLVDELPYDALDLVLGVGADLVDVCHAGEHGVPLLTAVPLVRDRYAAMVLAHLGLPAAQTIEEAGAQALALCGDSTRLSELHELLYWRQYDLFDAKAIMFAVERAYDRLLMQASTSAPEKLGKELVRAEAAKDWDGVLYAAHALDGMDSLTLEQRMSLAWAYFFRHEQSFAGRWALAAEGVPRKREGARLYLSACSGAPGTAMEIFARAQHGLTLIENGLSVVPDVRAAMLQACADHGALARDSGTASAYAMAYARAAAEPSQRYGYYGAALFRLNAVDVPAREVYEKSLGYAELFADVKPYSHAGRRHKDKIRVGYISGDFRHHVMQYFIWPFLAGFDSEAFEVYAYSLGKEDQYSKFFRTLVTQWWDLSALLEDPKRIARKIHADAIDILFDLSGHSAVSGLAALAWKPAPVQLSGLGYMATTGLPAVDYFVTDRCCDPKGGASEHCYVEKLLRLTSQFCYNGYTNLPVPTGTPARQRGYIQFVSFNQYEKLQDNMLRVWQKIMERVPGSRLLLKNSACAKRGVGVMLHDRLRRLGFDLSRVQFEAATGDYMQRYLDADIALDTFPWTGGGTTCDALYMGVPVVSYYTDRHSTRFTYSILANVGLGDLASNRLEDYIETAVALAGDLDLLDALHRELRSRMRASPVMDQEHYIREMEECYRAVWAHWEAQQGSV